MGPSLTAYNPANCHLSYSVFQRKSGLRNAACIVACPDIPDRRFCKFCLPMLLAAGSPIISVGILVVCDTCIPTEIFWPSIVPGEVVVMARFHSRRAWSNKCGQYEIMNIPPFLCPIAAKRDIRITAFNIVAGRQHLVATSSVAGLDSRKRPDEARAADLIEAFVSRDGKPVVKRTKITHSRTSVPVRPRGAARERRPGLSCILTAETRT